MITVNNFLHIGLTDSTLKYRLKYALKTYKETLPYCKKDSFTRQLDRRRNNAADAANGTKENLTERITKFSNPKATKMCTEFR